MYIKQVAGDLKVGCNHELSECTLIVGPNGSGKTTIIDSLALATTGSARSAKLGKDPTRLKHAVQTGKDGLSIEVIRSDGEVYTFKLNGDKKTWFSSSKAELNPEAEVHFSFDAAQAVLSGDPKKLRSVILKSSEALVPLHRIIDRLPADRVELIAGILGDLGVEIARGDNGAPLGSQFVPPEKIEEVIETLRSRKKVANASIKELKRHKELGVETFTVAYQTELDELRAQRDFEDGLPTDRDAALSRAEHIVGTLDALKAELASLPLYGDDSIAEVDKQRLSMTKIGWALAEVWTLIGHTTDDAFCPLCGEPVNRVVLKNRIIAANEGLTELHEWLEVATATTTKRLELEQRIGDAERSLAANFEIGSQGFLSHLVDRARIKKLEEIKSASARALATFGDLPTHEQEVRLCEELVKALEEQLVETVASATGVIQKRMNSFLPAKLRALIDPSGKSISMGFDTGNEFVYRHSFAISAAQLCELIVAFAAATAPQGDMVKILVIDETSLDPATVKDLIKVISNHVRSGKGFSQAILSLLGLTTKAVEGWTVINLSPPSKRSKKESAEDV